MRSTSSSSSSFWIALSLALWFVLAPAFAAAGPAPASTPAASVNAAARPVEKSASAPTTPTTPAAPATPAAAAAAAAGQNAEDPDLYRCKRYPDGTKIKVTLKPETELKDLVTWVMGFTCRNFVYAGSVSGAAKVTIMAPSEMTPSDAYRLFLVALQSMNLTVVPKGRSFEI